MKKFRNILMTVLVLAIALPAQAQIKVFAKDSTLLRFDVKHIKAETMSENDAPATFTYKFKNIGIGNRPHNTADLQFLHNADDKFQLDVVNMTLTQPLQKRQ